MLFSKEIYSPNNNFSSLLYTYNLSTVSRETLIDCETLFFVSRETKNFYNIPNMVYFSTEI